MSAPTPLPPGWYPDPSGKAGKLYGDGQEWHTAPPPVPASAQKKPGCLPGLVLFLVLFAALWIMFESCGHSSHTSSRPSSAPYSAPASFTVSNAAVAQLVHDAIAGDSKATPMISSPMVNCTGETMCTIAYTIKESSGVSGPDVELIEPTRQIWKALFTDAQFERATITVSGPTKSVGGIEATGELFSLACDRSAASRIDWDNVDGHGIKTLCHYWPMVTGLD